MVHPTSYPVMEGPHDSDSDDCIVWGMIDNELMDYFIFM